MRNLLTVWNKVSNYVTLGLGIAVVVLALSLQSANLRLESEKLARENDRITYEAEQAEYEAKALRQKQEIEERNRERAKEADRRYDSLLSEYNANLVRYKNAQRSLSGADLSSSPGVTEGSDGPGGSPELSFSVEEIIITVKDAEICAVNTARLKVVQEWATSQQEK